MRTLIAAVAVSLVAGFAGEAHAKKAPAVRAPVPGDLAAALKGIKGKGVLLVTLQTSVGSIQCELFEKQTPMTVANFVGLARGIKAFTDPVTGKTRKGVPFYDGTIFHRVIPKFMIQAGDRLGKGTGGPGYRFADEIHPDLRHDRPGVLSMANAGPGTNGSQFFITEVATPHLDTRHTVFGRCANLDVVEKIAGVATSGGNRPATDVVLKKVQLSRGPAPAVAAPSAPAAVAAPAPSKAARALTKADKDKVRALMGFFDRIAKLHENAVETDPEKGLRALDAYLTKTGPRIAELVKQLVDAGAEIDGASEAELEAYMVAQPELQRAMAAIEAFTEKHGSNTALMERWQTIMAKM
ncbi:MAG TPA: peptidylprolyl isomerase, partial [Kofleriaceae bacterium]|nr:peptidylprolyl isomerase [Kofleriaceae bacterium]